MLGLTAHTAKASRTAVHARPAAPTPTMPAPLRHRPATAMPMHWPQPAAAAHYFDAASHTALTLRTVLSAHQAPDQGLGALGETLMINAVNTLVSATCPQGGMDSESHAYFSLLMNRHLSGLEPEELKSLARSLKSAGYEKVSDHAALRHDVYDAFGFVTGKLQDVAALPSDWHHLLDDAIGQAAAIARRPLAGKPPGETETRAARQCLLDAAVGWSGSGQSMTDIVTVARQLSDAIGLSPAPRYGAPGKITQRGSLFDWKDDTLVMEATALRTLAGDTEGRCLPEVLRDLLELLVTRRMFGETAHPSRLCAADRTRLNKTMQAVLLAEPFAPEAPLRQAAARVLAHAGTMGKVQVLPAIGVALGHAAVGAALSIAPDTSQAPVSVGRRYMHPGFALEPDDGEVLQWPIRWLDANEHGRMFPEAHAWQVTVPVERTRLEQAAREVAGEWKAEARTYRFIGTAPGMPSTGCRASVLQAVARGMDADARALFAYFNAGLAEPESPTELAVRMTAFLRWLPAIAADARR